MAEEKPAAGGRDLVEYEGKDIVVRADLQLAGDVLFVTFSSRREHGAKGGPRPDGFGEHFLASQRIPYICFINKANHWWQTEEVPTAIEQLKRDHRLDRFARIVTYGASMGAYGALLFSGALNASDVLAFSPQYSVAGELPLQPEWRSEMMGVPILFEPMSRRISPTARVLLISDPLTKLDRQHIAAIEGARSCERVPVPFSGHSTSLFLHELGLLKALVLQACSGALDQRQFRQEIRGNRRKTPRYWATLGARLKQRGNTSAALRAEGIAVDISLVDERWGGDFRYLLIKRHVAGLLGSGLKAEAMEVAGRFLEIAGDDRAHIVMSRLRRSLGAMKLSVQQAKLAVSKAPRSAAAELNMSMALLAAMKTEAAGKHLKRAVGLKGGDRREWLEAAAQFQKVQQIDLALIAIRRAQFLRSQDPKIRALMEQYEYEASARPG